MEIEAIVTSLAGVMDAAAIAAGSGVDEHPLLFIVPLPGVEISKEAIMLHLDGSLARHKVSKIVIDFIEAIPRNASGKILRSVLKEKARKRGLMR